MATYTKANLRNQVMYDLTVLDAGESPSAEDSVLVLARIQSVLEELADESSGLIPFAIDGDEIPAPYLVPLARVIAPTLCLAFGKGDELQTYEAMADNGMRSLRRLKSRPYYGAVATATYY